MCRYLFLSIIILQEFLDALFQRGYQSAQFGAELGVILHCQHGLGNLPFPYMSKQFLFQVKTKKLPICTWKRVKMGSIWNGVSSLILGDLFHFFPVGFEDVLQGGNLSGQQLSCLQETGMC